MRNTLKLTLTVLLNKSIYLCGICFLSIGFSSLPLQAQTSKTKNPQVQDEEKKLAKDASTEINVKNADISAIVKIFGKKTKRNYILDERVKGSISIYLPGKVSSAEAIKILDEVLAMKGFTAVLIGENLWKIIPAKEAKQTIIPTLTGKRAKSSAAVVTRLINLKYIGAQDAQQLITPLISSYGHLSAYTGSNSLLIIDSEENIDRLVKIIETIDIPFTDTEMNIIPVEYAEAVDIAEKLQNILAPEESSKSSSATSSRSERIRSSLSKTSSNSQRTSATGVTVKSRAKEPKIIADERTNSIIVVADSDTTARIRALVDQLDSQVDLSGNRFYVYRCQHASAEELAEVLSGIDGGNSSGTRASSSSSSLSRTQRSESRLASQRRTPGQARTNNAPSSVGTVSLGEDISITADPATNSLIINAGKSEYEKIRQLLVELDIKRKQVLVEAVILEVGINDDISLGTEFMSSGGGADGGILASNNTGNLTSLFSDPTSLTQFTLAAASSGSLTLPGGIVIPSQTVIIRAAKEASNVNVLSSPTLLTTDNEEAEIVVGQNVPFLASTSTSQENLNNTFNQIDRQDVGITLRITPQISSSNFVTLNIFTEVSSVVPATLDSDLGPTTKVRTSNTTVITKDQQMVAIGGLISDDITESVSGVPFLADLPVIGWIFKVSRDTQQQTNLLIFITPKILNDQFDARKETKAQSAEMESMMDHFEVAPKREGILRSKAIDRVAETTLHEGEKPTTILPPQKIKSQRKDRTLHLNIKPEFSGQTEKGATKQSWSTPAGNPSGNVYVVLQNRGNLPEDAPFRKIKKGEYLGVIIPAESHQLARLFFEAGHGYSYQTGSQKTDLKALGIFTSAEEAEGFYNSSVKDWYTLSPYEIMQLGQGPWIRNR